DLDEAPSMLRTVTSAATGFPARRTVPTTEQRPAPGFAVAGRSPTGRATSSPGRAPSPAGPRSAGAPEPTPGFLARVANATTRTRTAVPTTKGSHRVRTDVSLGDQYPTAGEA